LQVLVETGLLGAGLLVTWVWSVRRIVWTSWAPAVVALAVLSLGMFPFRVPALGLLAAVIVGGALRERVAA
jgi:hypothetical protein